MYPRASSRACITLRIARSIGTSHSKQRECSPPSLFLLVLLFLLRLGLRDDVAKVDFSLLRGGRFLPPPRYRDAPAVAAREWFFPQPVAAQGRVFPLAPASARGRWHPGPAWARICSAGTPRAGPSPPPPATRVSEGTPRARRRAVRGRGEISGRFLERFRFGRRAPPRRPPTSPARGASIAGARAPREACFVRRRAPRSDAARASPRGLPPSGEPSGPSAAPTRAAHLRRCISAAVNARYDDPLGNARVFCLGVRRERELFAGGDVHERRHGRAHGEFGLHDAQQVHHLARGGFRGDAGRLRWITHEGLPMPRALHHQRLRHRGARRGGALQAGRGHRRACRRRRGGCWNRNRRSRRGARPRARAAGRGARRRADALGAAETGRSRPPRRLRGGRGGGLRVARDHILEFGSGRGGTNDALRTAPRASRRPRAPRAPQASSRWRGSQARRTSFPFSLGAPSTAAAVSAARPSPSFAGRFVTPDEAKDARSERAVDFASEARALRGDGAAGSHAGTDLLNSRWVSWCTRPTFCSSRAWQTLRRAPPACWRASPGSRTLSDPSRCPGWHPRGAKRRPALRGAWSWKPPWCRVPSTCSPVQIRHRNARSNLERVRFTGRAGTLRQQRCDARMKRSAFKRRASPSAGGVLSSSVIRRPRSRLSWRFQLIPKKIIGKNQAPTERICTVSKPTTIDLMTPVRQCRARYESRPPPPRWRRWWTASPPRMRWWFPRASRGLGRQYARTCGIC